jgi:NADH:ubiquinone oxidoreductase subunit 4 (subunit M)
VLREALVFAPMILLLLWLGLYPQPVFNMFRPAMNYMQQQSYSLALEHR